MRYDNKSLIVLLHCCYEEVEYFFAIYGIEIACRLVCTYDITS